VDTYEGWAIVEIMGHRRLAGFVREVEMYGGKLLRIDSYEGTNEAPTMTQFYVVGSVYCLTPTTEETARRAATAIEAPKPIALWELPKPVQGALTDGREELF